MEQEPGQMVRLAKVPEIGREKTRPYFEARDAVLEAIHRQGRRFALRKRTRILSPRADISAEAERLATAHNRDKHWVEQDIRFMLRYKYGWRCALA